MKALGLDFKDQMALESSGMDIAVLSKFVTAVASNANFKLEKVIKDEYDKKIKEINNNHSKIVAKLQPMQDLTQNGKSLPMAILEYILSSDGISSIIDKAKEDIMASKQM